MHSNYEAGNMPSPAETDETARGYLLRAEAACAQGNPGLGMHLYLTAAERAAADGSVTSEDVVGGLKQAWTLAIDAHERALAEYIFDKMEPFLTTDEVSACAGQLQELALLKLEEFGISRQALENMGQMRDGDTLGPDGPRLVHVEHVNLPLPPMGLPIQEERNRQPVGQDLSDPADVAEPAAEQPQDEIQPVEQPQPAEDVAAPAEPEAPITAETQPQEEPAVAFAPLDNIDDPLDPEMEEARRAIDAAIAAAQEDGVLPGVGFRMPEPEDDLPPNESFVIDDILAAMSNMMENASDVPAGELPDQMLTFPGMPALPPTPTNAATATLPAPAPQQPAAQPAKVVKPAAKPAPKKAAEGDFTLKDLHGYQRAVSLVKTLGLGLGNDPEFDQLVELLNARHGLDQAPAADSLLFRAPVREDALRFIEALVGEINLPSLRMRMEDGPGGTQSLCIMTRAGRRPRMNNAHTRFEAPAVLVVEDLDLWAVPDLEPRGEDPMAALVASQISRGARDAVALIRSAVEDPDVYVLATASTLGQVDPYFCELITPFTIVDIDNPTAEERADLWGIVMEDHPSVRGIPVDRLVELSAGLSREDILLATREAIEEAYRESLALRTYLPVTAETLYAKLSAFYPLDSPEYRSLEDLMVADLRSSLDGSVDELLGLA
ncbi:MAG: hypothetical protein Q4D06_07005 [Coriobacteriia bacterium]|nr:hypothetical protein [Coriobacteriia bacterium]